MTTVASLVSLTEAMRRVEAERPRTVVLVEGVSDQRATEALAAVAGLDLRTDGVLVLPMQGATNLGKFLAAFGPDGLGLRVLVLSDGREAAVMRQRVAAAGMPTTGVFACDPDLEAELIRAIGVAAVEEIVAAEGDLRAFRSLQRQPQWREQPVHEQLRRFFGSGSGRKIRYGPLLASAVDPGALTGDLAALLRALGRASR